MHELSIQPLFGMFCRDAARLHIAGIPTGFISSLGLKFQRHYMKPLQKTKNS